MSKQTSQQPVSKRQALKQQRLQQARKQRLITIVAIVGTVALLIALIIIPQTRRANPPISDFVQITPDAYSQVDKSAMGDPNAPVKIEVFSDFKCNACAAFSQSVEPQLFNELIAPGTAYYVFHHYPFMDDRSAIKESDLAAEASFCAAEQNRFFDYKKMLYANLNHVVGEFSESRLIAFAKSLGLNMKEFQSCMDNDSYKPVVDADIALADQYNVTGTPSLFVNGQEVTPGYIPTFEEINKAVQAALTASK
jgi:protein-disulfide isomerase